MRLQLYDRPEERLQAWAQMFPIPKAPEQAVNFWRAPNLPKSADSIAPVTQKKIA
ncbi:MAG: hypothetical protein KME15_20615 [Drouetiella hepatica Uher 2000/2452]|jgi:hypothetical protein|uniref:Uncharacterized protein n=1 Tax=Drouetiella hepatica Uher 2000/2452 TaxID=904376 RepID=A0A951UPA0_9CYAN|nr:hypothetical protein [Drouetiella hepatica Uher 2000/2452]